MICTFLDADKLFYLLHTSHVFQTIKDVPFKRENLKQNNRVTADTSTYSTSNNLLSTDKELIPEECKRP
jgi:hypothetical protein